MAEVVQFRNEQTISELEQMQRIELFSKEEIRLIAAKRKRYEYKMQRSNKSKDTYLRYIQYEVDLIRLIQLRRANTKISFKEEEIERVISSRITNLFQKALTRHKNDIKLWITFIKYCMHRKVKGSVSRLLVRMLTIHNNKVKVWKFAANFEYRHNNSIDTARKLMLRGLRFHPKSKSLYKAYLAMELNYANEKRRLLERRDKLEQDLTLEENGQIENRNTRVEKPKQELKTKLAEIIIDSALMRFQNVETFVEICAVVRAVKDTEPLQEKLLQQLQTRFPNNELVYDLQAKLAIKNSRNCKSLKENYSEALDKLPTEKMWSLYLEALSLLTPKEHFLKLELDRCQKLGLLNVKFYPKLVMLLRGDSRALPILLHGLELDPKNIDLHRLHIEIHLETGNQDGAESAFKTAEQELGNDNLDMLALYKTIIQYYENTNFDMADKIFKKSLFGGPNISSLLKPCYLQWVYDKKGIDAARAEYKSLYLVPLLSVKLHEKMINLEMAQPKPDVKRVRLCYDLATHQFGEKNLDLWRNFIAFEVSKGDPKLAPLMYNRAKAQLSADLLDYFVAQHTLDKTDREVKHSHH